MSVSPIRIALVGFGRIMQEDHLPAVLASTEVELVAICDPDVGALEWIPADLDVATFPSAYAMLGELVPDAAIVAVPHAEYLDVLKRLAAAGVHVLKEKPLAATLAEAAEIAELSARHDWKLMVTLQRRFNPIFRCFEQFRQHIGRAVHFDFRYTLNVPALDLGWRADAAVAGGGCLIDMGYHTIDLILWYFGLPEQINCYLVTGTRELQDYTVEDTCSLLMSFASNDSKNSLVGSVFISRVFPRKEEKLTVVGTRGVIDLDRHTIKRLSIDGEVLEELARAGEWPSSYLDQLNSFVRWIRDEVEAPRPLLRHHFEHVALVEAAYVSARSGTSISPAKLLAEHGLVSRP